MQSLFVFIVGTTFGIYLGFLTMISLKFCFNNKRSNDNGKKLSVIFALRTINVFWATKK
ncbi:MAG: hypothetical protein CM15mP127_15420 [Gammaproteobacteria bacterium]|nr:MAG: hypothetical protein CM15mP127_15420 [Gammaproteobacteria bacterium]